MSVPPSRIVAGGRLDQAQDAVGDRRLAAPGLADEPEHLAAAERERDAVDRVHDVRRRRNARAGAVVLDEIDDLERGGSSWSFMRARGGSRRPDGRAARERSSGTCVARRAVGARAAVGERAAVGQLAQRRDAAGDLAQPRVRAVASTRGIAPSRPIVYGCWGSAKRSCTGASSALRPAYITSTRSASSATTPRLCVIRMIAVPSRSRMSRIRSRIPAWVVTSSAVVGSSAISTFGSQASAIAIITRCRIPPESWCG